MNIFICQTPFQLFYANQIIKHFNIISGVINNCLVFHSNLNIELNTDDTKIEYFNLGNERGVLNRFIQFKKAKKIIDIIVKTPNQNSNFFIPHISGFLSNYIFYCEKLAENKNCSLNFFYEGVLYFYDFEERFQKFHRNRFLLGVLLGIRYKYNKIIFPYKSQKIKHIYTPIQKFTKGDVKKLIEIPFKLEKEIEANPHHYLILGGPVSFLKSFYEDSIKEIIASSNKEFIIYYKGHASFKTHNPEYKNVFSEMAVKYNIKYVNLSNEEPVELLIEKIKPFKIYSYYSSALLNISLMYPNNFKILCYFDENNNHFEMFKSIFNHYNIETIVVN